MIIGFDAKRAFHNSSGLGNYSRNIIRILSNQFPDNKYLLYTPKKGNSSWLPERPNVQIRYPEKWIWKKLSSLWRQRPVSFQIKTDRLNIYHGLSNEIPHGIDSNTTKIIVTIHDLIFIRYPEFFNPIDRQIYINKFRFAAKHSDVIIAISYQTKRDIVHYFNTPEQKIVVHYQGCDVAFKKQYTDAEKEAVKKKFDLPEQFILNVGTIERRKNILVVLKAINGTSIHIVIVGRPTSYKNKLTEYIREHRMENRVHFLQGVNVTELAMMYQLSTLFCYPSIFEGFGIPIIEALYSRVPVITSRGGCFCEAGGPGTRYADSLDVAEWKDGIEAILSDRLLARSMVETGLNYVQKFNNKNVGLQLMAIYESLMKAK